MSFRNRLALFFVLIVLVPMLAVAFLLFRLIDRSAMGQAESAIAQQHNVAVNLFGEQRAVAGSALEDEVGKDSDFTSALQDNDIGRARARVQRLIDRGAIQRVVLVRDGEVLLREGSRRAIAPAVREVQSSTGRTLGRLEVSVTRAHAYARRTQRITGLHTIVFNGGKVLASTLPAAEDRKLPTADGATTTLGGTEYRVQNFTDPDPFAGQKIRVFTLGSPAAVKGSTSEDRMFAGAILLGFFLLAIACAVLVSRTLQQQIAGFLTAARKLAGGDFSVQVPTVGRDEFAALGEEFNTMSRELERRLAELGQERTRVQDSMRRLGEAVASNLDRDALLELVVRTAVEGAGAAAGRASVRANRAGALQERSRVGNMDGLEAAMESVEAEALRSGRAREATVGAASAIASPLHRADGDNEVVGVVSVGRTGRPFTPSDRELFNYLAGQAARSMENVDLHEAATRESMTDELTELSNRRAFDDTLSSEIERARRFGTDLGLVFIDLDNFKTVNDTYGHPQGDLVLRAVARVLREGSREIDHLARIGGEELAVVLPGTDLEGAFNRAERIREQIGQLRIARLDGGGALNITTSCGVAAVRGAGADGRALLQAADTALYEAKRSGKNASVRAR